MNEYIYLTETLVHSDYLSLGRVYKFSWLLTYLHRIIPCTLKRGVIHQD